eukprot:553471_1
MGVSPSSIALPLSGREFPDRTIASKYLPDWLTAKKKDDQKRLGFSSSHWCIANKCYNFTPWIDKHPGGQYWIKITQGLDCTGLFETHHPSMNYNQIFKSLDKYFVCNVKNEIKNDKYYYNTFTFDPNKSHYNQLRDLVYKQLINTNKTSNKRIWNLPNIKMHILSFFALLLFLIGFIYLCLNPSIVSAIICGICLHPLIGVAHNFAHQAENKGIFGIETYWQYVIYFTLSRIDILRIHHILSHHTDINLNSDVEVYLTEPLVYFMSNQPTNSIFVYIYSPILFFIAPPLLHIPTLIISILKHNFKWYYLIPLMELMVIYFMNYNIGIYYCILYWTIIHGVMSLIVVIVATPIHRSDFCWSEGDINGTKDFVEHCLLTTKDYYTDCGLIASLFGFQTFNDHRIHHLFPTLDASKVSQIKSVLKEYCLKQDELKKYFQHQYGLGQLFVGFLRHTADEAYIAVFSNYEMCISCSCLDIHFPLALQSCESNIDCDKSKSIGTLTW